MLCTIAGLILLMPRTQATAGPSPAELAAIKKLSFLVGTWEGEGWSQRGPQRETYKGSETVRSKLQGKALLVEGLFIEPDSKKTVHETLAVITFDEKTGKYRFNTFLFNQPNGEYELKVLDNGFAWQMKPAAGIVVDFTMKLTDGQWIEIGEFTMEGREKTKFMEMRLKKVGS
jgi:hypothetical protein